METHNKKSCKKHLNFLVLLPHRDSQKLIEDYRQELFSKGFLGAYSFPIAAPLAILSRPLIIEEIKKISAETRKLTLQNEGKITAKAPGIVHCPDTELFSNLAFFGTSLDISFNEILTPINDKITYIFPEPVICAALSEGDKLPKAPAIEPFSFRAAQLANLAIRPLESGLAPAASATNYSFEWRLSKGAWIPKYMDTKV